MNNKKTIIILILVLFIGIIGLTFAYFSNSTTIDNLFSTKEYGSTITETFTSPNNWLPGDVTEKKVVATNTGEVDQAVRISYTEKWLSTNKNELNGWIHEDGSKSSHTTEEELNTDERVALINFDNNDDWTYNNGYYYYNYRLQPNESTSSLIKSVSFNSKTKLDDTCTTTISEGKKTITCNSSGDNYDGATYTLTFKIETVQYDKYMNAWNTDVAILNEQALFCDAFEVGEVVEYNNAEYYVLKDSSTSDDYVTLLKKDPLTASEVNQYSTDYVSQDGEYPYYESDTCNENTQTGCSTNYDTSDVKKILDGWSSSFSDDLVSIDGYKTRLIGENDITFEKSETISEIYYKFSTNTPVFVHNSNDTYWTMIISEDSLNQVYGINYGISVNNIYNKSYIRPVINLKKSAINRACYINNINQYLYCDFGEEVTYDNQNYYVLEESNSAQKYVTLLKKEPLTASEVNLYSVDYVSQNGEYPFCLNADGCRGMTYGSYNYKFDYSESDVKKIVDKWSIKYKKDLVNINKIETRLMTIEELNDNFDYRNNQYTDLTPPWIYLNIDKYWSMSSYDHSYFTYTSFIEEGIYGISSSLTEEEIDNNLLIRPVINLKKSAIENGCHVGNNSNYTTNYTTYSIGETISYNNSNYCVISNSSNKSDYVTLIKQEPLSYDELVIHNNGYDVGRDNEDNNAGTISYYKSNDCYYNSDYDKNTTGCSSDYDTSNIKVVIDNWSNSFTDDLKEINGYKARLITYDEIMGIGYANVMHGTQYYLEELYGTKCSGFKTWYNGGHIVPTVSRDTYVSQLSPVRPVINLKKCVLTNSCE